MMDTWFKCDKGWLGVGLEHRNTFLVLFDRFLYDGYTNTYRESVPLHKAKAWAEENKIPYEISTTKPIVAEIEKEGE